MINDLLDLDGVLGQYDPGKVLVGPLLNLSINSSFRFFYIAGNGGKVYESIGLGFIEAPTEAERQRGDIVAKLQSRFGEVKVIDNQLAMAREANTLWPNEETARFLATTALEAKLQPTQVGDRDETPSTDGSVLPSNQCEPAIDEAAAEPMTLADAIDSVLVSGIASTLAQELSTSAPHRAVSPARLPDAYETWPLNSDATVTPSRHALEQDDVALAVLRLKSPRESGANTEIATTAANAETIADRPVKESGRSRSMIYRLSALSGAAAIIAGIVVVMSTRHIAKEASQATGIAAVTTADGANDRSRTTGTVILPAPAEKAAPPAQAAETVRSQATAVPNPQSAPVASARGVLATGVPPPQAAKAAHPQIDAPHASGPQSPPSQMASTQETPPPASAPQPSLATAVNAQAASSAVEPSSQTAEAERAEPGSAPVPTLQSPAARAADSQVGAAPVLKPKSRAAPPVTSQVVPAAAEPQPPAREAPRPQDQATSAAQSALSFASSTRAVAAEPAPNAAKPAYVPPTPPSQMASAEVGTPPAKLGGIVKPPLGADELDALLSRSSGFLKNGDFAAARILLRRAVESGSADAALMLGKTFDPLYLNELGAMGIQPDVAQARQWYQKAVELGSEAAAQRLANLGQTGQ